MGTFKLDKDVEAKLDNGETIDVNDFDFKFELKSDGYYVGDFPPQRIWKEPIGPYPANPNVTVPVVPPYTAPNTLPAAPNTTWVPGAVEEEEPSPMDSYRVEYAEHEDGDIQMLHVPNLDLLAAFLAILEENGFEVVRVTKE